MKLNNKRGEDLIYECQVIARNLYNLRMKRKLTFRSVTEGTNIPPSTIFHYESGEIRPSKERLSILAKFYHVSEKYLLTKHKGA